MILYPDVYLKAIEESKKFQPNIIKYVALEDSPNGVKSAKLAGCYVVMIPDLTQPSVETKQFFDECYFSLADFKMSLLRNV